MCSSIFDEKTTLLNCFYLTIIDILLPFPRGQRRKSSSSLTLSRMTSRRDGLWSNCRSKCNMRQQLPVRIGINLMRFDYWSNTSRPAYTIQNIPSTIQEQTSDHFFHNNADRTLRSLSGVILSHTRINRGMIVCSRAEHVNNNLVKLSVISISTLLMKSETSLLIVNLFVKSLIHCV